MINNRKLRRDVIIVDDIEKIRWFETKECGIILGNTPTYLETEITNQDELDSLELEYETSIIRTILPPKSII